MSEHDFRLFVWVLSQLEGNFVAFMIKESGTAVANVWTGLQDPKSLSMLFLSPDSQVKWERSVVQELAFTVFLGHSNPSMDPRTCGL